MKKWTLKEALELYPQLTPIAESHGYMLSIYGSILRGEGEDFDLMATPWRFGVDPDALIFGLAEAMCMPVPQKYRSVQLKVSVMFDNKVDLQIMVIK